MDYKSAIKIKALCNILLSENAWRSSLFKFSLESTTSKLICCNNTGHLLQSKERLKTQITRRIIISHSTDPRTAKIAMLSQQFLACPTLRMAIVIFFQGRGKHGHLYYLDIQATLFIISETFHLKRSFFRLRKVWVMA